LTATLFERAISAVAAHPAVVAAEPAGSRARGTHAELSDWDVALRTSDFASLARDLPMLVAPLEPLGAQWEPRGHFPVYALMLRGPTVVEYLFLERTQRGITRVEPSAESLPAIHAHFWAWIWWLGTKASIGRDVSDHWPKLYGHMLGPMGAEAMPESIETATRTFLECRTRLEREHGVELSRALETEVLGGLRRLGYKT